MLLADVTLSWTEIGSVATAAGVVIAFLYRALIAAKDKAVADLEAAHEKLLAEKDKQLAEQKELKKSYKEMAEEAVINLENVGEPIKGGKKRPVPLARVIPEHHSPTTEKQRDAAELQTTRAKLVAATLQLGLPPREESPPEVDAVEVKTSDKTIVLTDETPQVTVTKKQP